VCIEIYARDQAIEIPFAQEIITFRSPTSFDGEYTMLVKNAGKERISQLLALYPRPLMKKKPIAPSGCNPVLRNVHNVAEQLIAKGTQIAGSRRCEWKDGQLTMWIPNPNKPEDNLPQLVGRLTMNDFRFVCPAGFLCEHVDILDGINDGFSAWALQLTRPLESTDSLWITLVVRVERAGRQLLSSLAPPVTFHTFAAPQSVRTTLREAAETGAKTAIGPGADPANMQHYQSFLDIFGLGASQRQVAIGYYELTVIPGSPLHREITDWTYEGQLWMRSSSPKVVKRTVRYPSSHTEVRHEPIFEWKSGRILDQFRESLPADRRADMFIGMDFRLRFSIRGAL